MKWQLGKVFQSILAYLECRFSGIWKEALRLWYQKTYFVSKEPIDKNIIVCTINSSLMFMLWDRISMGREGL